MLSAPSARLATRLLVIAAGSAGCQNEKKPPPAVDTEVAPVRPEGADEPETDPERPPPSRGATAQCADRMACVPGSWCAHVVPGEQPGFFGQKLEKCRCTPSGHFACPAVSRFPRGEAQVCVTKSTASCPASDSKEARDALVARWQVDGCPTFRPKGEAAVVRDGAGADECCYTGQFGVCEGRPLWIGGTLRHAVARRGVWG